MKTFKFFLQFKRSILCAVISQLYYSRAATFWDLEAANLTSYEEEALVYTLQGLVNRVEYDDDTHKDAPELFFNTYFLMLIDSSYKKIHVYSLFGSYFLYFP